MNRSSKVRGTSATEQLLSIAFVLCMAIGIFLAVHKKEVMNGEIDQVIASYIEGASDTASDSLGAVAE